MKLPSDMVLKEKYAFECYSCGFGLWAKPSIFMEMGMNMGGGSCPRCSKPFQLQINETNDGMNCFAMPEGPTTHAV